MASRTIVANGNGRRSEKLLTAVAVPPGTLLERVAGAATVQAQSTAEAAGTYPEKLIAMENSLAGDETGTNWAASSRVQIYHAQSGDEVYLRLEDGEVVAIGDHLTANGTNGTMKKRDTATNPPFAVVLEAKDALSDAVSSDLLVLSAII
ncbi:MAG: hypothetical protein GY821_12695 [Gammaproteobacteria bacterium]|nr:hypothetical protein [Gammaproteobacteria bacterium]